MSTPEESVAETWRDNARRWLEQLLVVGETLEVKTTSPDLPDTADSDFDKTWRAELKPHVKKAAQSLITLVSRIEPRYERAAGESYIPLDSHEGYRKFRWLLTKANAPITIPGKLLNLFLDAVLIGELKRFRRLIRSNGSDELSLYIPSFVDFMSSEERYNLGKIESPKQLAVKTAQTTAFLVPDKMRNLDEYTDQFGMYLDAQTPDSLYRVLLDNIVAEFSSITLPETISKKFVSLQKTLEEPKSYWRGPDLDGELSFLHLFLVNYRREYRRRQSEVERLQAGLGSNR